MRATGKGAWSEKRVKAYTLRSTHSSLWRWSIQKRKLRRWSQWSRGNNRECHKGATKKRRFQNGGHSQKHWVLRKYLKRTEDCMLNLAIWKSLLTSAKVVSYNYWWEKSKIDVLLEWNFSCIFHWLRGGRKKRELEGHLGNQVSEAKENGKEDWSIFKANFIRMGLAIQVKWRKLKEE